MSILPPGQRNIEGWPWIQPNSDHPDIMPNGSPWPKITVVTPSFNQGDFIEEAIRSVLLQCYPNLEYVVIDGGSSDNSKAVIKKYEPWLSHWVSEKDRGQSHALNKGFRLATGEILAWLNSDDMYLPNALFSVALAFAENPDADLIIGKCDQQDCEGNRSTNYPHYETRDYETRDYETAIRAYTTWDHFPQPSTFFTKSLLERVGEFDEKFHYTMDLDYWIRAFKAGFKAAGINQSLSVYRLHEDSKTMAHGNRMAQQTFSVLKSHCGSPLEKGWWARWSNCYKYESGHHVRLSREAFTRGDMLSGLRFMALSFKWPPEALRNWIWIRLGHFLGPRRRFRKLMQRIRS